MLKAIVDKLEDVDEAFRSLYSERNGKFEITGIEGMRTQADVDRLQSSLEKERKDHKETKSKFAVLGEKSPEEIVALLDKIPELEAAAEGKLDDDKISELADKRVKSKVAPLEREIDKLKATNQEQTQTITNFESERTQRTIQDGVREAVGKAEGFQQAALEDALVFGERQLTVNEEGKVVTKENVGVTPGVDPVVWLSEMQQRKPHWWGPTGGGGGTGNRGGGGGTGTNPFSRDHWNLTEQGRILTENRSRAEQLAKSAGTSIGGPIPAEKK